MPHAPQADWKLWLYLPGTNETLPPTGAGTPYRLSPVTDKNSTAFGNPSFKVLPCPPAAATAATAGATAAGSRRFDDAAGASTPASTTAGITANTTGSSPKCVFVSFFAFGEGAAPGEAGVVAFYNLA